MHLVDLCLTKLPGRVHINLRKRRKEWVTLVPRILHDLAPTSTFDLQQFWKLEREIDAKNNVFGIETCRGTEKRSRQRNKKKTVEIIKEQNRLIFEKELLDRDLQMIRYKKERGTIEYV